MKRSNIIALSALTIGTTTQIFAGTEMDALKDRITALESAKVATKISGELSATYDSKNKTEWGDAQLTISHALNEGFDGLVTIKRDGETADSEDRIVFDEAMINYHASENITLSIGRIGVPFGAFDTGMVTDPLTKGIADADKGGKDMLMLAATIGDIEVLTYTYKDNDSDSGLSVNYVNDNFSAGFDHFKDGTSDRSNSNAYRLGIDVDNFGANFEKISTNQGTADNHSATHFEVSYTHVLAGMDANLVLAKSDTNVAAGDNEQTGVTYALMPAEGITIALESNKVKNTQRATTAKVTYEF